MPPRAFDPTKPIGPDDPVTFAEAAEILLRGLVTASTLEAAAKRGELETERLGRRIVTTPAMIERWRSRGRRPIVGPHAADQDDAVEAQKQTLAMLESLRTRKRK